MMVSTPDDSEVNDSDKDIKGDNLRRDHESFDCSDADCCGNDAVLVDSKHVFILFSRII